MNRKTFGAGVLTALMWFYALTPVCAGLPSFQQVGNILVMSNVNVTVQYNLSSGTADFYWQNAKKISAFYSSVHLSTGNVTSPGYSSRGWAIVSSNQVVVTNTGGGLPVMSQYFTLDQDNSFLTSVTMTGSALSANWMGPVVMNTAGGMDIGVYNNNIALFVPFDNDHFVRYNAESMNGSDTGNEVGAFYDNTTRNGLVVGSVTHDTWKTGVYWSGSNNKLDQLQVFGGVTNHWTWDVMQHGSVVGNTISSPTIFVGFGGDWRAMLVAFAAENALFVPKLSWTNGAPFGWNSWGVTNYQGNISYPAAVAVSDSIHTNLEPYTFNNGGTAYVNLDSYWNNLNNSQLQSFTAYCHANGQKAGVYWGPFDFFGNANDATNYYVPPNYTYRYSDILLKDQNGHFISNDGAYAIDPTHPGTKAMIDYYASYYTSMGFDYVKLDFLSHGSLEGVHYDPTVMTGMQAFNQAMQRLNSDLNGHMFISESISPLFPYQYGNSRRIACDAQGSYISDTEYTMNSVSYGWWLDQLYSFNDPDIIVFGNGPNSNENQSRLICGAATAGIFLDGDVLTNSASIALAQTYLTNSAINNVIRGGQSFRVLEGDTGSSASDMFVRQNGSNWYVAVFNYTSSATNKTVSLGRAGLPAVAWYATNLFDGTSSLVSGSLSVSLNAKQAKLFELGSLPGFTLSATPPSQTVNFGGSTNYTINVVPVTGFASSVTLSASGLPAGVGAGFNPMVVAGGSGSSTLTVTASSATPGGSYPITITGTSTGFTNTTIATLMVGRGPANLRWAATNVTAWDVNVSSNWFNLNSGSQDEFYSGDSVLFDDTPGVSATVALGNGVVVTPSAITNNSSVNNFTISGAGKISGATGLVKLGAGTLTLYTANDFTGNFTISGGIVKVANGTALGAVSQPAFITNSGTLDVNTFNLGAKPIIVSGAGVNGNGAIINGTGSQNYALQFVTLAGDTTFGGVGRWDIRANPTAFLTNNGIPCNLVKTGANFIGIAGVAVDPSLANIDIQGGTLDYEAGTTGLGNPDGTVTIRNNAILEFWNAANPLNKELVLLDGGQVFNGSGANAIIGPVTLSTNAAGGAGNCTFNIAGTSQVISNSVTGIGNLIKSGGSPLYMSGANAYTGNTTINTGTLALTGAGAIANSQAITVASGATLSASGRGDGTLSLASGQTLQGSGAINGALLAGTGSTVSPGTPLGRLTVSSTVTLQGNLVITINKSNAATNAQLFTTAQINYGGTLIMTNVSGALLNGDSFKLFNAASYSGAFTGILPATPGTNLAWNTNSLTTNGTLNVVAAVNPRPVITNVLWSAKNMIISGSSGVNGANCVLWTSTNLFLPFSQWTPMVTSTIVGGGFSFTNAANLNAPQNFYIIGFP